MTIDDAIDAVIANEGGYVDDPADAGGETNWGVTVVVARQEGYTGDMRSMPRAFAAGVYRRRYVEAPGFDRVATVSMPIAAELVDTGANMGPAYAGRFLQRALNQLVDGAALTVDGQVGSATLAALRTYLVRRGATGERRLLALLNGEQAVRYLDLAEGRPANRKFFYGWLNRIVA